MSNPLHALDSYDRSHLVHHLVRAGRIRHLAQLLRLETGTNANAWYEQRHEVGDVGAYRMDLAAARVASRALPVAEGTDLLVRTALGESSVVSRAGQLPPALLPLLATEGIWTRPQVLAFARGMQHPGLRAEALIRVTPCVDRMDRVGVQHEALLAVKAITSRFDWYPNLLPGIAAVLPDEALAAALACPVEKARLASLRKMAPVLPLRLLPPALSAATPGVGHEYQPAYQGSVRLEGATEADACEAMIALIERLPAADRPAAAELAEAGLAGAAGRLLCAVASSHDVQDDVRADLLGRTLEQARMAMESDPTGACLTLVRAARTVRLGLRSGILSAVRRHLEAVPTPAYPEGDVVAELAEIDPDIAMSMLGRFAGNVQARVAARMLRFLEPASARALATTIRIAELALEPDLIDVVASFLPVADVRQLLRTANAGTRDMLAKVLVRHLPDDEEALAVALTFTNPRQRARVANSLVGRTSSRRLLAAMTSIDDAPLRAATLASIGGAAGARQAEVVVGLALDDMRRSGTSGAGAVAALARLSPIISESAATVAVDIARLDGSGADGDPIGDAVLARLPTQEAMPYIRSMVDLQRRAAVTAALSERLGPVDGLSLLSSLPPEERTDGLLSLVARPRHTAEGPYFYTRSSALVAAIVDPWARARCEAYLLPVTDPRSLTHAALGCTALAEEFLDRPMQVTTIAGLLAPWCHHRTVHDAVLGLLRRTTLNEHGRRVAWTLLSKQTDATALRAALDAPAEEHYREWDEILDPHPAAIQRSAAEMQECISLELERIVSRFTGGFDAASESVAARFLKSDERVDVELQDAFDASWRIGSPHLRARALSLLLPRINQDQHGEIAAMVLPQVLALPFFELAGVRVGLTHPLTFWLQAISGFADGDRRLLLETLFAELSRRPRSDLLAGLWRCADAVAVAPDLAPHLARCVIDAGRWWP